MTSPLHLSAYGGVATRSDIEGAGGICSLLFLAMIGAMLRGCGGVGITLVGVRRLLAGLLGRILAVAVLGGRHGELGRATLQQREFVMRRCAGDAASARETVAEMLCVSSGVRNRVGDGKAVAKGWRLAGLVQGGGCGASLELAACCRGELSPCP